MTYNLVEEYFLRVEKLFAAENYADAKNLLNEMLEMEPGYGRAHNHMGWLYYAKFDAYEKSEYHYRLAIKFAPEYPASYLNLSYLLVEMNRYEEARAHAAMSLTIPAVNRDSMYNELGRIAELSGDYKSALFNYREAVRYSLNKNRMETYRGNIARVESKVPLFSKRFLFF
jgi:tetratricopeptide (TPR) repeat protein